jgi:glucose/arabinose dehydrogenase
VDAELPFAGLVNVGTANQPVDLAVGPEGALYVSTINALYRIKRYP